MIWFSPEGHERQARRHRHDGGLEGVLLIDVRGYEGEPASTARDELEAAGLKVRVVEQYNDDVDEGLVIRQWPNEGSSTGVTPCGSS